MFCWCGHFQELFWILPTREFQNVPETFLRLAEEFGWTKLFFSFLFQSSFRSNL